MATCKWWIPIYTDHDTISFTDRTKLALSVKAVWTGIKWNKLQWSSMDSPPHTSFIDIIHGTGMEANHVH